MISPKICHCIHPFFREYAPVSTPSSYCIRYSVIKRYSVIVLYKMHIVHWAEHGCNGLQLGNEGDNNNDDDDDDDDVNDDKLYEKCWASWKVGSGKTKGLALIRRFLP